MKSPLNQTDEASPLAISKSQRGRRRLVFSPFTIDLERATLSRDGEVRILRRQSFDVLRHLAERSGSVVPSEEIAGAIWHTKPAYPDASLAQCIKDIRKALGDHQWMIRTVPGIGYELTPAVQEIVTGSDGGTVDPALTTDRSPAADGPADNTSTPSIAGTGHVDPPPTGWQSRLARNPRTGIAAALLLAMLASALLRAGWNEGPQPAALNMLASPSVRFAPAAVAAGGPSPQASIVDEVATELTRVPRGFDITILSPSLLPGAGAGGRGDARYVVITTFGEEGSAIRISVQLLEAPTGQIVWARPFVQKETAPEARGLLAAQIARLLAVEIRRIESQRPLPTRPEAGHYALMGRVLLESERGGKANARAMAIFDKGVAADAKHVQSLLGYARTRLASAANGWADREARPHLLKEAEQAIDRVLGIDRASPGAHLLRGVLERAKGNFERSLASLEHARSINPRYALVHAEIGRTLLDLGRPTEAVDNIQRALHLSPTDPIISTWYYWMGISTALQGDFEASLQWLLRSAQANPHYAGVRPWTAIAYARLGDTERARKIVADHIAGQPHFSTDGWVNHFARGRPEVAARLRPLGEDLTRLGVPALRISKR